MTNPKQWYDFQEQIAEHFRMLGVSAKTNVSIEGVRTSHDVDVCKRLAKSPSKLQH